MPTVTGKVIRLGCNQSSGTGVLDKWSEEPIVLWQGGTAQIQCVLFNDGPAEASLVTDLTGIVSATLLLRQNSPRGTVLLSKTVLAVAMDATVDWDSWLDDTKAHFTFELSSSDTNQSVPDSGNLPVYFSVTVTTSSSDYVAAFGYGKVQDVGIVDVGEPTIPNYAKVYRALLTQSGTSAPSATVLENSLGGTVVWTRAGVGSYAATLNGAFPANKTFTFIGTLGTVENGTPINLISRTTTNVVTVASTLDFTSSDDALSSTPIEILVYP